jgi:ketosteroid isomerase-like protein
VVKNLLLFFAFAASLATAPAGWAAAASGDAVPGPVAVVDAFHSALKANDPATALKMLSVSVSIFEQGFVDQTRADYSGAHITADAAFAQGTDLQVLERRIIWLGDNAACVISKTQTQGSYQGHAINLVGTETMVLQRSGNSWTIEHIHWSAHPGEGEAKPVADKH